MSKKNGNWTINETENKFENEFFKVSEDKVIPPDGKEGLYATIVIIEGVAVLPIDDDGNAYITRQFRYALGRKNLEAIAGGINKGEPLENAKRETKEELGIEANEWISLGKIEGINR